MAMDYSKKKNAELEDLLRARSLPHTGKKADLIARLQQHDREQTQASSNSKTATKLTSNVKPSTTLASDDEIDWDGETAPLGSTTTNTTSAQPQKAVPTEAPALSIAAAGGKGQPPNPRAVPNQSPAIDPSTTSDLTVTNPSTDAHVPPTDSDSKTTAQPAADFTRGLGATSLDSELEKRKRRAERFGVKPSEGSEDAIKALERTKKFGTAKTGDEGEGGGEGEKVVKGLDSALPERSARKRGREGQGGGGKRVDSRKREGRGGGRAGGRKDGGGKAVVNEKDRLAAEARKKRFATAA